jgi:hypothetical protein
MDRRTESRIPAELPVRIWGVDGQSNAFSEVARVKNLSDGGAVIEGVRLKLKPGDLMDLQYGPYRAQFRIVWTGKLGSDQQGEVGLQRLPLEECIWGVNLEASCAMAGSG